MRYTALSKKYRKLPESIKNYELLNIQVNLIESMDVCSDTRHRRLEEISNTLKELLSQKRISEEDNKKLMTKIDVLRNRCIPQKTYDKNRCP